MPIVLNVLILGGRHSRQILNKLFNGLSANAVTAQRVNCALKLKLGLLVAVYFAL